jgi:hypothetical protein
MTRNAEILQRLQTSIDANGVASILGELRRLSERPLSEVKRNRQGDRP